MTSQNASTDQMQDSHTHTHTHILLNWFSSEKINGQMLFTEQMMKIFAIRLL